jgi:hypothetical protein
MIQLGVRIAFVFALWAAPAWPAASSGTQFVENFDDFRTHVHAHRYRVRALGLALFRSEPLFAQIGVTEQDVYEFLSGHDHAKILPNPKAPGRTMMRRLYEIYATDPLHGDSVKSAHARALIGSLNAQDDALSLKRLQRMGFLTRTGKPKVPALALLRIERIADVVDRNLDPVAQEEFSRLERAPLEPFFTSADGYLDQAGLEMARFLSQIYLRVVRGLTYDEIRDFWSPLVQVLVGNLKRLETIRRRRWPRRVCENILQALESPYKIVLPPYPLPKLPSPKPKEAKP